MPALYRGYNMQQETQHVETGHIVDLHIINLVVDGVALAEQESRHLELCDACQQRLEALRLLRDELHVARQSRPSAEAEEQLVALLAQARQPDPSPWLARLQERMGELINAMPLWDTRQQGATSGVRNANKSTYRMLFGAHDTEVELMVEPQGAYLRVVGEILVDETAGRNGLALIELMASADSKQAIEAESDVRGRFALERVPPGRYVMTIIPRHSNMVVIEPLELT